MALTLDLDFEKNKPYLNERLVDNITSSVVFESLQYFKKVFMLRYLKKMCDSTKDMFVLPQVQILTVYGGLLWAIPLAMVTPFRSLYLVSLGLSDTEVGLYNVLFIPFGLVGLWVGGYLTDAWGRKKTLFFFDTLSWGSYCFCMTIAFNKWCAVAALFFMTLNLGSLPAYQCLLIEGIPNHKRGMVYSVLQITNLSASLLFFPLLGGYWVARKGLVSASHEMFGLFTLLVVVGILLRLIFLSHSGTFEQIPQTWRHGIKEGYEQYSRTFKQLIKKPGALPFISSKVLDEWMLATWGIYSSLYFVRHLGLTDTYLSLLAQVSAYAGFGLVFFFIPRLSPQGMIKLLGLDQILGLAAIAVLFIPVGGFWSPLLVCLLSASLGALGVSFYGSASTAVWMNMITEKERAKVVAASISIFQVGVWILGSLSAFLYGRWSPIALLILMMIARLIGFVLLRRAKESLESTNLYSKD
jgi:DHA1 family tetracycline resistance protein-like MFS transporter